MDPTPYFIMGMMCGAGALLLIQAYGRRKVRNALGARMPATVDAGQETVAEMRRRVEILEQIVTEQPLRLEREIERLR